MRFSALCSCLLALTSSASAQAPASPARVWEAPLVLPTYELGVPDPDPALLSQRHSRPIYPYPVLDALTDQRVQKSYKAVYLENEYLRVTVLPELGGRIYSIYDRTVNREVLYTNHVVKYGKVAIRGAWVSGGIEWNFPDGHSLTTVSPVDYSTRKEDDGSAVVCVGDTERVQGMQWTVAIRLRPGRKAVEAEVTLCNRRDVPGRYWYWANGAAPAAADLRFVYPMREAYPHTFWPVFSFPKYKGVDLGTYREVPVALSLFARDSRRNFFGIYYEKADRGIVHVADHSDLAGKKTWTWGTDPSGRIWVDKLTEHDGQYVEFQAGRFETQMEHEFIAPHRVERFVEYWYPVERLGGPFVEANQFAALRLSAEGRRARVSINTTLRLTDAHLALEQDGKIFYNEQISFSPDRPFATALDLGQNVEEKPVTLRLTTSEGAEIVFYRTDTPVDGNPDYRPAQRPAPVAEASTSAEKAYLQGLAYDKDSDERDARAAYEDSLKCDPGFSPARVALGLLLYRSGLYEAAEEHLAAALRRDRDSVEGHYYLGLVKKARGETGEATEQMNWVVRSGRLESLARYQLGAIALAGGRLTEALDQLSRSVTLDPRDVKTRTTLALTERLAGRLDAARVDIEAAVYSMPLDYFALSEQYAIARASGRNDAASWTERELWRLLSREPDSILQLAFDYAELGRIEDCGSLLQTAIRRAAGARAPVYPMLHYALGYLLDKAGDRKGALAQYALGSQGKPDYVYPHRVEEIEILRAASAANPSDGRAPYYLGNALAARDRQLEALQAWRTATSLDSTNPVGLRNYALALWRVQQNNKDAVAPYERAIALAPDDFHLYLELDGVLRELGDTNRRIRLLEEAPLKLRPYTVQALAGAYLDAGRFADAAGILERSTVISGEGESGALAFYRKACLGLARDYQREGKHEQAAAEYLKATQYPVNLGVGRSSADSHAVEYVAAAGELDAAGQKDTAESLWRRAADEPLGSPVLPNEPWSESYYYKAEALRHVGRTEEARELLNRLAALADNHPTMEAEPAPPQGILRYILAGLALKSLGRVVEARTAFENVIKLDPLNERAKDELAGLAASR